MQEERREEAEARQEKKRRMLEVRRVSGSRETGLSSR